MPLGLLAARAVDKNAAHGLGGGAEKVGAILPAVRFAADADPGFVDERGRLQSLPSHFAGHLVCGDAAQFVIHEREEFLRSQFTRADSIEEQSQVVQGNRPILP